MTQQKSLTLNNVLGQTSGYFNKKTVIGSVTIALGTIIYSETHIYSE